MICKSQPVAQTLHRVSRCDNPTPPNRRDETVRLPILPLILSLQFVAWCIFGVICHGWQILLYPMSWGLIVAAFLILNYVDNRRRSEERQVRVMENATQKPSGDIIPPVSTPSTASDTAVSIN